MKFDRFYVLLRDEPKKMIAVIIILITFGLFILELIKAIQPGPIEQRVINPNAHLKKVLEFNERSPIFTFPLFGEYIPANLSDANIKKSTLDLVVVGVMYSEIENNSQVLIQAAGGKEKTYGIGDTLPGGAVIKRITPNGAVVLYKGVLESLSMPKDQLIFEPPAKPLIKE